METIGVTGNIQGYVESYWDIGKEHASYHNGLYRV